MKYTALMAPRLGIGGLRCASAPQVKLRRTHAKTYHLSVLAAAPNSLLVA